MRIICNVALPMRRDVVLDRMTAINQTRACGPIRPDPGARIHLGAENARILCTRQRQMAIAASATAGLIALMIRAIRLSRETPLPVIAFRQSREREREGETSVRDVGLLESFVRVKLKGGIQRELGVLNF